MAIHAEPSMHPRVFISYSHDSEHHVDRTVALADRLRAGGVDCELDEYQESPPEGWDKWMVNQIHHADYIIIVCTEVYARRFEGREERGKGLGATWEGAIITNTLYQQSLKNLRFLPIIFSADDIPHIPSLLQPVTRYDLSSDGGYEALYRRLTAQPRTLKPELGQIHPMPPKARKHDFQKPLAVSEQTAVAVIRSIVATRMDGLLPGILPRVGKADLMETAILSGIAGDDALRGVHKLMDVGLLTPLPIAGSDDLVVNLECLQVEDFPPPDANYINWAMRMRDAAATRPTLEELKAPVAPIESLKKIVSLLAHRTMPHGYLRANYEFPYESALALNLVLRRQDNSVALTFEGLSMLEQIAHMETMTTLASQMIHHPAMRNLVRALQLGRPITKTGVLELPVVVSTKCLWQWIEFLATETGAIRIDGDTVSWTERGTDGMVSK